MRKILALLLFFTLIGWGCSNTVPGTPDVAPTLDAAPTRDTILTQETVSTQDTVPVLEETTIPTAVPTPTIPPVPEPVTQGIDACAVFTLEDVEAFVGQPMEPAEAPVQGEGIGVVTSCAYQIVGTPWERASAIIRLLDDVDFSASFFAQTRRDEETYLSVVTEDVSGVGDEAYWIGDIYNQVSVRKGTVHLLIGIPGQEKVSEAYIAFMQQVLDRLP